MSDDEGRGNRRERERSRSPVARGNEITAREKDRSPSRAAASSSDNEGKMIVLGVSWSTSNERFKEYFAKYGELNECELIYDRDGKSRGFGFIHYKDRELNRQMLRQSHELDGRRLELKPRDNARYGRGAEPERRRKVFVGRLPENCTEDELNRYFTQYGNVTDVFMPVNKETRRKKGCAFVEFETADAAQAAVRASHNLRGNDLSIEIAEPRKPLFPSGPGMGGMGGGMMGGSYDRYGAAPLAFQQQFMVMQLERARMEQLHQMQMGMRGRDYRNMQAMPYQQQNPEYPSYSFAGADPAAMAGMHAGGMEASAYFPAAGMFNPAQFGAGSYGANPYSAAPAYTPQYDDYSGGADAKYARGGYQNTQY